MGDAVHEYAPGKWHRRSRYKQRQQFHSIMANGPLVLPNVVGSDPLAICAREEWMELAACLDVDPELFFPEPGGYDKGRAARRICGSCPVRGECLQFAVDTSEQYGIWGGMSLAERRKAVS